MKKILFYTMTMRSGGAERVIANLANEFIEKNNVSIITLINSTIDYELDKRINIISSSNNKKSSLINRLKSSVALFKETQKYNPDIIIAFCPTMCFLSCVFKIISKKFRNVKLIISERNDPNNEYKNIFTKKSRCCCISK